jgi:GntR family transcriptional regulator
MAIVRTHLYESVMPFQTKQDDRLPRYQRIRDSIAARIAAGEWKAGDCIASEAELAATYDVAVGTVRRAIDKLEADGLIQRAQGKGMFVRRADFSNSLFRFFRLGSADERPLAPTSQILSREIIDAPADVKEHLGLGDSEKVVRMRRLRMADGKTLLREEIWLPAGQFPGIIDLEATQLMPLLYPAYEQHFGRVVARANERLSIETAGKSIAMDLDTDEGATVVRIERIALDHAGRPMEWRVSHGLAGQFVYEAEVS